MIKKRLIILGLVGVLTVGFSVGCTSNKKVDNSDKNNISSENTIETDDNIKENEEKEENNDLTEEKQVLKIYSQDINTGEDIIVSEIEVNKKDSIEDILNQLANKVSEDVFSGLPIELLQVSENNGEKIAIINLRENDLNANKEDFTTYEGANWAIGYFQGSAGGAFTSDSLLKTFLQSDNSELSNWIDGVQFLYNNKPINSEHVEKLSQVTMRK